MAHHRGGDGPTVLYTYDLFGWMERQIIMINDFPYVGMDYMSDLEIPLLVGIQWGDLGQNFTFWLFFVFKFVFFLIQNQLFEIIMQMCAQRDQQEYTHPAYAMSSQQLL